MFYKLINAIKFNIIVRRYEFFVDKNKNNIKLLNLFIKLNIIKSIKINEKNITVLLNKKIYFRNIKNMYKPSKLVYLDLKNLKSLTYKRGWICILSTDRGLSTNMECIRYKIGGVLIACLII